jgi:outer membrane protein assembly factor BamB
VPPPLTLEWDYDITGGIGNGSPLIVDSVLMIGNLRGELYAINAYTGKRMGWVDLGDAIQGTPIIDGNVAIVTLSNTDLSLVAFNLSEGKAQWRMEYGDIEASPLLHNKKIFAGNVEGAFYCVDLTTGAQLWKFELPDNAKRKGIRSSAAGSDVSITFGADDGYLYALDAERGIQMWRHNTGASVVGSPCIANGNVYVGNLGGTVCCVDLHSGKTRWQFEAGASIYASPSFADSKIFIGTTSGMMYALDATTGALVWKTDLGSVINSSAVVAGNVLYVGTLKKMLFGLNIADGTPVLKQEVPGRIKTSPAVAHGRLFVATDERLILSFRSAMR